MDFTYWVYLGLFVVFLVIEAITFNLVTIWMAAAALLTSIYAYFFPEQYIVQAFICIVLSVIFIAATKPLTKKLLKDAPKTNADRLLGETGIVIDAIDDLKGTGQVKVKGQIWSAKTENGESVSADKKVKIKKIEGVKLVVSEE